MIPIETLDALTFSETPIKNWKGKEDHTGPGTGSNAALSLVVGKTTMATMTLMAGVLLWGAKRVRPFFDTDFCLELAEASFAWHWDWRYINTEADPYYSPPNQPAATSATFVIDNAFRECMEEERQWFSFYQPLLPFSRVRHVVRHILTPETKKLFDTWVQETSWRLAKVASTPKMEIPIYGNFESREAYIQHCYPMRGAPIPPCILDPAVDMMSIDLAAEAKAFRETLDPSKNRFLRSASEMAELGFEGEPYA